MSNDPTSKWHYFDSDMDWEVRMRADRARIAQLEAKASDVALTDQFFDAINQVNEIQDSWSNDPNPEVRTEWHYLNAAVEDWENYPDTMSLQLAVVDQWHHQGLKTISRRQWRSLQQARELTGNGEMEREPVLADIAPEQRRGHLAETGHETEPSPAAAQPRGTVGTAITFIAPNGQWRGGWHHAHDTELEAAGWAHEVVRTARPEVEPGTVAHVSSSRYVDGRPGAPVYTYEGTRADALADIADWGDAANDRDHDCGQQARPQGMPWANEAQINTAAPPPVSSGFASARTRELAAPAKPVHAFANATGHAFAGTEREGMER